MQGVQTIEGQWGRSVRHHEQGTGAINMLSTPLKKTTETPRNLPGQPHRSHTPHLLARER